MRRSVPLIAAFGSLLLIIGGAAFAIRLSADRSRREVAALHEAHLRAGDALATIRSNVFLAGILNRDYLLDPDPAHPARYAEQFDAIRAGTESAFNTLAQFGHAPDQKLALDRLHQEVSDYWDPTTIALNWTPAEKNANRAEFLHQRVRHRAEVVQLADEVERLLSANFSAERRRITSADDQFEFSLAWITAIALLLALGIAMATVGRIVRLERQSEKSAAELRALSSQIRMAQENERRVLSRELHDQAGQMLTGLRMELASMSYASGEAAFTERIAHARGVAEQTLRVIRNIAAHLRPSMLDDLGLAAALHALVRDLGRSSSIEINVDLDPAIDGLPEAQCNCTYRVMQEALTNAVRHSAATCIELSVTLRNGTVNGKVSDNGHGFAIASLKAKGIGLAGMEERIRELGGNLRIASSPKRGTNVDFLLPAGDAA